VFKRSDTTSGLKNQKYLTVTTQERCNEKGFLVATLQRSNQTNQKYLFAISHHSPLVVFKRSDTTSGLKNQKYFFVILLEFLL